jgi:hypothetical protein
MPLPPGPALSAVVPPSGTGAPTGFTREMAMLDNGLPASVRLPDGVDLVVVVPTGSAVVWRDADPLAVLSASAPQAAPDPGGTGPGLRVRPAPRLLVRIGGQTVATVPLVAGLRRAVPDDGSAGVRVEIVVLGWQLTAGSMQGPGAFGSWRELAWRRADVPYPEAAP